MTLKIDAYKCCKQAIRMSIIGGDFNRSTHGRKLAATCVAALVAARRQARQKIFDGLSSASPVEEKVVSC